MVLNVYKKRGETPLECLNRFKSTYPEYKDEKMTYAGRLDPMAEGILIVLTGGDVYDKNKYTSLPKVYEAQVLLGARTDTYDLLGVVTDGVHKRVEVEEKHLRNIEKKLIGPLILEYPPYSSKTVQGKPLWLHARMKNTVKAPKREMMIYNLFVRKISYLYPWKLAEEIEEALSYVQGDFRQQEILESWNTFLLDKEEVYPILTIHISCGSGTYIRSLAHEIGIMTEYGACLYSLVRTKVGKYEIHDAL